MRNLLFKRLSILFVAFGMLALLGWLDRHPIQSASLSSVSVTLSNPRLSFRGGLASGNSVGSSLVTINTTVGSYPSTSSAQLVQGDVVKIGEGGSLADYTVASTSSVSTFSIATTLATGDADAADDVISSQSANLVVRFTTANAVANGRFRILVPALASNTASADGIPDGGYFDFGASAPTVTCPSNATATYDFVTGVATASTITIDGNDYHSYECAYSGTGAVGTAFNASANDAITISNVINPAPKGSHTTGTADTYKVIVQHSDSSFAVQDSTAVSIGVIEAVKVTASVPAQISFQIIGLATGTSACGVTTDVTTTPAAVPFGEVSIATFNDAAQALTVTTNAVNGFAVTAIENDQLSKDGNVANCVGEPTIAGDTSCIADAGQGTFSETAATDWTSTAIKGFGYSLHDVNTSTTEAFAYNGGGTFMAKQFPATEDGGESAETIFSSTAPSDNHNIYVCYRLIPGTTTAAGDYENYLTYTATATF